MEKANFKSVVMKVSITTIIGNVILTLAKIVAGILAKSSSLVSDGVHSGSDVLSTIVVMVGAKLSSKEADDKHPYGHERLESIASIVLGMLLVATAVLLGYNGIMSLIDFSNGKIPTKNEFIYLALGFAIGSIVLKFLMYLYTVRAAKKIGSTSLKADAYHHLSDSLSSIGSVLGIVGILIGGYWAILDPIASLIIALLIVKVAYDILKEAINQVVDTKAPEEYENEIIDSIKNYPGVKKINNLKTRQFGNKYYIELEIAVDANISVKKGHDIANGVHDLLENKFVDIKHCTIHIDPYEE